MRSFVRYYTIRSGRLGTADQSNQGSRRSRHHNHDYNKRGRKREWRKKLDAAKSLRDFLQIEIQEPPTVELSSSSTTTSTANEESRNNASVNNAVSSSLASSSPKTTTSSNLASIFRNSTFLSSSTSTTAANNHTATLSPSTLRKSKSYNDSPTHRSGSSSYDHQQRSTSSSSTSTKNGDHNKSTKNNTTPLASNNSNHHIKSPLLPRSKSNAEISNSHHYLPSRNQIDIEAELGMTGTILLQTTYRLKEARMQATANYKALALRNGDVGGVSSSGKNNDYGGTCTATSSIHELGDEDDDEHENHPFTFDTTPPSSLYNNNNNIIAPFSPSQQQQQDNNAASSQLKFLLQGVVKRNHLSINDLLIQDALSVMESGRHHLTEQSRNVILNYHEEVEQCLKWIADHGLEKCHYGSNNKSNNVTNGHSSNIGGGEGLLDNDAILLDDTRLSGPSCGLHNTVHTNNNVSNNGLSIENKLYKELTDRHNLIRKLKHNMGRTALMLSGGGAQAMYHLGTIKALCESKLYDDIHVISGTSGGSISAAMCAIKTREELLKDVCVPHVSTDYGLTGVMKKENIRWFPKVLQMGEYWLKHKLLVDPKEFKRCCDFYYGDITFEEAFERTGKHVCITVSASRAKGGGEGGGAQRLLLNHISTPHVTIASAVAASCALPGVMAAAKLITKNQDSVQEYFEVDGVEWIDGSVQADLPFKRISTLFNVSNYIVCQTNFHVLPFLHKAHHPNTKSFYWRVFQTCEWDIRNRVLNLSRLGLFPKIFGQDMSKVFKQKYHGDLTLVPKFTTMQLFGLQALVNPTYEDMELYLQNGQSSAWPYLR